MILSVKVIEVTIDWENDGTDGSTGETHKTNDRVSQFWISRMWDGVGGAAQFQSHQNGQAFIKEHVTYQKQDHYRSQNEAETGDHSIWHETNTVWTLSFNLMSQFQETIDIKNS